MNPEEDGITHINIYSKGKTTLGALLSNFTYLPIFLPEGIFHSLEGYWYWLLTRDNRLMRLSGYQAKKLGQKLTKKKEWLKNPFDIKRFKISMRAKSNYPAIKELMKKSTLPFVHYYVFNGKIVEPSNGKWMLEEWELIRKEICSSK